MLRTYLIAAAIAYLLGSIPFGYILVRAFRGQDIRTSGSGNIGATNVARSGALGLAVVTLLLDALKGYLAILFAHAALTVVPKDFVFCSAWADFSCTLPASLANSYYGTLSSAALMAVIGHMFPVWLKFRGGKGVATAVGSLLALAPHSLFACVLLFLPIVAITRYVSLGSVVATAAFPVFLWVFNRAALPNVVLATTLTIAILIITKHHRNIRRLLSGSENRFALKRKAAAAQLASED
jgi:glycerol-3-phosphate acyltransferase PlsY